jgi:hypothetical protein
MNLKINMMKICLATVVRDLERLAPVAKADSAASANLLCQLRVGADSNRS